MKRVFLDKDGTLVRTVSGETFVQNPEDQELIEGVIGKCRKSDKRDGAGMLRLAARHGGDRFLMIGDRPEDKKAAEDFGCQFIDALDWIL